MAQRQAMMHATQTSNLADLLERILDKGIVIDAWVRVSLVGIDLITVDQPVPNANLGTLIGKLAQTVVKRVDEDSKIETTDEVFILFVVGADGTFTAPFKGRIYLGVNENVLKDNGGAFSVVIVRRPA